MELNFDEHPDTLTSILLVFNEKDKKVSAVTGIDEKGNLKTVEPTVDNEGAFLKVDKNANAFSNFFSNFWKQLKNPNGLHFFKSDRKDAVQNAQTIQDAIVSNDPVKKKEIIEKFYVKTEQEEKKTGQSKSEDKKQVENEPQKRLTFYDRQAVKWKSLENFGITEKMIEDSGEMENLLNRKLTSKTFRAHGKFDGSPVDFDAAVQLRTDPETKEIVGAIMGAKKAPDFKSEFFGEKFDEKDQENFLSTGNLGRVANLKNLKTGTIEPHFVSLDPLTNRFFARKVSAFKDLEFISKAKLTPEIKEKLMIGEAVTIPGMKNINGKPINCPVQLSGHPNKYVDYLFSNGIKQKVNENGEKVFYGTHVKGVPITPDDCKILNNKGYLKLTGMRGNDGGTFDSYVIWDSKKGVLKYPKTRPQQSTSQDLKGQNKNPNVKQEPPKNNINKTMEKTEKKSRLKVH